MSKIAADYMFDIVKGFDKSEPTRFGKLVAEELAGISDPQVLSFMVALWKDCISTMTRSGVLRADLPVTDDSLIYGLTDHGRDVVARYEEEKQALRK
ncbi:hypothetical protein WI87_19065 [Burkholderia ubonensis]|nr:hypothetical protein [Burkholderia ubonensis]KVD57342.1 hypothetical protein WI87_19065 [Burkholderia ubonensis]KVG77240.1 hypothetical protein WJ34_02410 [Burkholderia ubonensis]KVH15774.1 hypothetical protein WJ37_31075 [Burkholderia ubonensis]KVH53135.1 hypothetical protein WJ38_03040 [Burkholderia ubonensis]KVH82310.1 hypothetical protein WJ43_26045 [Burkholderia ubonensis]